MSPLQIQHVISESQEDHAANGQKRRDVLDEIIVREFAGIVHQVPTDGYRDEQEEGDKEDTSCEHAKGFGAGRKERRPGQKCIPEIKRRFLHFHITISFAEIDASEVCGKEHGLHLWYETDSDHIGHCRVADAYYEGKHFNTSICTRFCLHKKPRKINWKEVAGTSCFPRGDIWNTAINI